MIDPFVSRLKASKSWEMFCLSSARRGPENQRSENSTNLQIRELIFLCVACEHLNLALYLQLLAQEQCDNKSDASMHDWIIELVSALAVPLCWCSRRWFSKKNCFWHVKLNIKLNRRNNSSRATRHLFYEPRWVRKKSFRIYCLCKRSDKRNKYFCWLDTINMIHFPGWEVLSAFFLQSLCSINFECIRKLCLFHICLEFF